MKSKIFLLCCILLLVSIPLVSAQSSWSVVWSWDYDTNRNPPSGGYIVQLGKDPLTVASGFGDSPNFSHDGYWVDAGGSGQTSITLGLRIIFPGSLYFSRVEWTPTFRSGSTGPADRRAEVYADDTFCGATMVASQTEAGNFLRSVPCPAGYYTSISLYIYSTSTMNGVSINDVRLMSNTVMPGGPTWTPTATITAVHLTAPPGIVLTMPSFPTPDTGLYELPVPTIVPEIPRNDIYNFLATADTYLASAPEDIQPLLPVENGAAAFRYAKWLIGGTAAADLFGPFAPIAHNISFVVALVLFLALVFVVVFIVVTIVRFILSAIKSVWALLPFI